MRICIKCGLSKELTEFGKKTAYKDGINTWCKQCNYEYTKAYRLKNPNCRKITNPNTINSRNNYNKQYRELYPEKVKNSMLKHRYGITLLQYEELLKKQNGVCAICGKQNENGKPLFVDHNHITNEVRELLCSQCNSAVGYVKEDIATIEALLQYLKKHSI